METLKKNLILAAVLSAETIDTAGEQLNIRNADISTLPGGIVNTEHKSPDEIEKSGDKDFKGFNTIVGKVKDAKKIFSEEDCSNQYELDAWNDLQVPLIFGYIEMLEDTHDNAKAATAIARKHPELLGFSVEGQILKRKNHILDETLINKVALTYKPANRVARIKGVIEDSKSQNSDAIFKAEQDDNTILHKSISPKNVYIVQEDFGLSNVIFKLRKALDAGSTAAAPSALTGGAALQTESHLAKLDRHIGRKPISRDFLKKLLKGATEEQLEKVYSHLKLLRLKKNTEDCEKAYSQLKK